jgi:RNA polymerase sigma-32 factor
MPRTGHDPLATYIAEVNRYPQLPGDEEKRLARAFRDTKDRRAAQALVTANLRFVVKIALEYRAYGLRVLDLIQEGNLGLVIAVARFDPERGVKLVSYAVWWIRAYVQAFILRSWSLVKIGTTRAQRKLFFKMRRESRRMRIDGQEPEASELAAALGVKTSELEEMQQRLAGRDLSVDTPTDSTQHEKFLDRMHGHAPTAEELIEANERETGLPERLREALAQLDPRERSIFLRRHRDFERKPPTLKDLGEEYGVSRERIRQIEQRAKSKLREILSADGTNSADQVIASLAA